VAKYRKDANRTVPPESRSPHRHIHNISITRPLSMYLINIYKCMSYLSIHVHHIYPYNIHVILAEAKRSCERGLEVQGGNFSSQQTTARLWLWPCYLVNLRYQSLIYNKANLSHCLQLRSRWARALPEHLQDVSFHFLVGCRTFTFIAH